MDYSEIVKLFETIPYDFRWAKVDDWKPAMMLVWKTFMKFEASDYSEEGIKHFFEFITDDDIYRAFLAGRYRMMIALDGEKIIGVGTLRNTNMLSLLFVDEAYHRRGVGSVLVELLADYIKKERGENAFYVKAAPYAVKFYEKAGFVALKEEQEKDGIRVTPMERLI